MLVASHAGPTTLIVVTIMSNGSLRVDAHDFVLNNPQFIDNSQVAVDGKGAGKLFHSSRHVSADYRQYTNL